MKLEKVLSLLNARPLIETYDLQTDIKGACGADLMSDVLASIQPESILLTGLTNPQVVRTSTIADVRAVIFVRGKTPPCETVKLAEQEGMPLFTTPLGMFEACGRLFQDGLPSLEGAFLL